ADQSGTVAGTFPNAGVNVLLDVLARPACAERNDLPQPANEFSRWRDEAVGAGEIQMRVRVDKSGNNGRVAAVEVRRLLAAPRGKSAIAVDDNQPAFQRWAGYGKDVAGGQRHGVARHRRLSY